MGLTIGALIEEMDYDINNWRKDAACKDTEAELFFPIGNTGAALLQIEAAKAICRTCPVREDCLEYALTSNQESGVWGAHSEEERRIIRRQRAAERRAAKKAS